MTGTIADVTIPGADGRSLLAALALPGGAGPCPGVIVIHEALGLNDDIRRIAARFATLGYAALAPDLFTGRGFKPICIARTMRALSRGRGRPFDDIEAARAWLAGHDSVDGARMGIAGFCMGGGFALLSAARVSYGAAAVFYGAVPKEPGDIAGVCGVVGGYGDRDRMFGRQGKRLRAHLDELDVPNDVRIYDEAGHSFMNRHSGLVAKLGAWGPMKVAYDHDAAEDSWERIERFFGERIGPASGR